MPRRPRQARGSSASGKKAGGAPKIAPSYSKVIYTSKDITERGFSAALLGAGVAKKIGKGEFKLGKKFSVKNTGLTKARRKGMSLSFVVDVSWKDKRGRVHRDKTTAVIVRSRRFFRDTKKEIPQALLSSFLFALDRQGLRADYNASFRQRVGQKLKKSERPKFKDLRFKITLQGHKSASGQFNL